MGLELPNCRATGIGSTPHVSPAVAVDFVLEAFPDLPFWPQLPRRGFRESIYAQYSEYVPGIVIDDAQQRIRVQLDDEWPEKAEGFYFRFLEKDPDHFALSPEDSACIHELLQRGPLESAWAAKGHAIGPVSFGMQVTDQNLRPSFYDDMMRDVIVKNTLRHAQWQEAQLRQLCERVIVFIDEPFLSMLGSAFAAISREDVVTALEEIYSGLACWTGTHCCANTDWSLLMETAVDIISFDAYEYAENLALYPGELRRFLDRGGMLAWGVIPSTGEVTETTTLEEAREVFERALTLFERKGFDRQELLPRSFLTPACGTGTLPVPVAERVMRLTGELSDHVREAYGLE